MTSWASVLVSEMRIPYYVFVHKLTIHNAGLSPCLHWGCVAVGRLGCFPSDSITLVNG